MSEPRPLTPKQRQFVDEYLIDLNGTQAAIRAGYSARTARSTAAENLTKPDIVAAIGRAQEERAERTKVTQDYVLTNLSEVVERCMERAPVMVRDGRKMTQAVDEDGNHVWRFDAQGSIGALSLLGRHLKLFTDKTEHSADESLSALIRDARAKPNGPR